MDNHIHKYDMGVIGNCSYLAYINKQADVVWMCLPRFDSPFMFGSLLDKNRGGVFSVTPFHPVSGSNQYYLKNTNILITEFTTVSGSFRITDYAPRFYQYDRYFRPQMLIRKIEPISGQPAITVHCKPVGDYGAVEPEIVMGSNHIRYMHLSGSVRLTSNIPLLYILENTPVLLNETKYLVLTYGPPLEASLTETCETFLDKTKQYWMQWVKGTSITNMYQEPIIRSALILKLHQYEDTGGIIASGTTSLPEFDNSTRNWDYRYCWLRDTYFTLTAFNSVGHFEELEKYFHFIQNIVMHEKRFLQPLYTITGSTEITERELPLDGYRGNTPVRIGNAAYLQKQYDVYGLVLASLLPLFTDKRLDYESHIRKSHIVKHLLDCIDYVIDKPDAGIWEFRGREQHHCYTFLCHWVGCKTALKIADVLNDHDLAAKASSLIEKSASLIEQCYNPQIGAYTQAIGSTDLDASTLQLILLQYLDPHSEKAASHLAALEKQLGFENGLFHRYIHKDDFGVPQTTFLACAFWYVEALACVGRLDDAINAFDNLLAFSNHLGLLSEHVDHHGGQWGNFPQTYSHVGLMNAAYQISRSLNKQSYL